MTSMQQRDAAAKRLIWDLPTRVFHWALAGSFVGAYVLAEQDELAIPARNVRYTVAGLVAFRLLWGLIGSKHSRFRDFAYSPVEAIRYLRDLRDRPRPRLRRPQPPRAAGRSTDCSPSQRQPPRPAGSTTMNWVARRWKSCMRCSRMRGWCWSQCTSRA